jgi:hypothetical protein
MRKTLLASLLVAMAGVPSAGLTQEADAERLVGAWRTVAPTASAGTSTTLVLGADGSVARIRHEFSQAQYEYDGKRLTSIVDRQRQRADVAIHGDTLRMRLGGDEQAFVRDPSVAGTGIVGRWSAMVPHPNPRQRGMTPMVLSFSHDGTFRMEITLTTQLGRYSIADGRFKLDIPGDPPAIPYALVADTLQLSSGRNLAKYIRIDTGAADP